MVAHSNAQKTHFALYMSEFARNRALDEIMLTGKALPASVTKVVGPIVTVKFEVDSQFTLPEIAVPLAGSEYIRLPIQVGCKGVVFPADAGLGAMSGLGTGTAKLAQPQANLSALVFFPIGNKTWSETDSPTKTVIYGPDGTIIRDTEKKSIIEANADRASLKHGAFEVWIDDTGIHLEGPISINGTVVGNGGSIDFGNTNLLTTGNVTSAGTVLHTHTHGGVQTGGGNTGGPN